MNWNISITFLLFAVAFLGCDGSKKAQDADSDKDTVFEKVNTIQLGKVENYKTLKIPVKETIAFCESRFFDSEGFNAFKVITQNEEKYYLIAKGTREGKPTQFGLELGLEKGILFLEDFNKLYYTCIARYCSECAFKFDDKGTISGCNCDDVVGDKPQGYAACEHTIAIKTSEKE